MPKTDGTGFSSVPSKQGLEAFQDAKPAGSDGEYGQGGSGGGPEIAEKSSRTSDVRGGGKGGSKK